MTASPSIISVLPASTDKQRAPAAFIASIVDTPTTGTSNRMSCSGLATLTIRTPRPASCPARAITASVPSIASTATTAADFTAIVCPMSRPAMASATRYPNVKVGLLLIGRAPSRQHADAGQQRREKRRRVEQLDAVVAQHVGHAGDERVGVPGLEPHQHAEERQVGHDVGEELRVLHLPRHHRLSDAGLLEHADALAELAERHPVQRRRRRPRGGVRELGEGLLLDGDDGDVVPSRARRIEDEKGKPAVAGDQAEPHARLLVGEDFLRPARRAAEDHPALGGSDEVQQILHFGDRRASDPARSACRALVVLSFDCSR